MFKNIKTAEQLTNEKFDMAMSNLRAKRNKLLSDTDYLALADNTMTEEVKTYRQALRDITIGLSTVEEVNAVVFPVKP
jgi:vacuolar-type H+-ATPase subunit C/Vma6